MAKKKYEEPIIDEVAAETQREPDPDPGNAAEAVTVAEPVAVTEDVKEDFDPDFVAVEVEPAEREPDPDYPFDNSKAEFPKGTPIHRYTGDGQIIGYTRKPMTVDRASVMVGDTMWYKVGDGWVKK